MAQLTTHFLRLGAYELGLGNSHNVFVYSAMGNGLDFYHPHKN